MISAQTYPVIFDVSSQDSFLFGPDAQLSDRRYPHKHYAPANSSTAHLVGNDTFEQRVWGNIYGDVFSDSISIADSGLRLDSQGFGVGDRTCDSLVLFAYLPASGVLGLSPLPGLSPNNVSSVWENLRPQLDGNILSLWFEK
jgi:Eukaryotic aspartyl protease